MKKIILMMLAVALLAGCQQTTPNEEEAVVSAEQITTSNVESARPPNLLNAFNKVVTEGTPYEAKVFLDKYMSTASELDADIMLTMFVDQQRDVLDGYTDLIFNTVYQNALLDAYDKSYNLDKLSRDYSDEIMSFLEVVKQDGFLLNYHEGMITLYPDYNLLQSYVPYVSESIRAYVEILSRESSEILSADGGLTISWEELSFRVLSAEEYLVNYEDSIRYNEVFELYKWYLNALLTGLPDTPIYYRNSNLIRNDVLQSYNKVIIHNADTVTASVLTGYLDVIRSKNNKVDGDALTYVRDTLKNLDFTEY
ncbi:MAG: hypothetical protein JXO44_03840 [Clostridia bacterium]|nr:hypothetical protein [Clostridia bacterium]